MHEPLTNLRKLIVIQLKADTLDAEIWRALYGASSYSSSVGKMTIAVNEDIDPENLDMVMWAMAYRMRPHQDMRILDHKDMGHGPRAGADDNHYEANNSAMLINAMLKRPYPPISLPARQYMERPRRSGRNSACRHSSRKCRGTAIRSANGRRNSRSRPTAPCAVNTGPPAK